jgi:hypothetical protein
VYQGAARRARPEHRDDVGVCNTHFFSRIKFCANRSAYKNAYQIIVYMKTFQKNKSCIGCIALHGMAYYIFLKSLRSLEEFRKDPHVKIPPKSPSTDFQSLGKFKKIQFLI